MENFDKIREIQKIHYDSTTPMDSYHTGMWNGMECILCLLEGRDPKYKSVERFDYNEVKAQDACEVGSF